MPAKFGNAEMRVDVQKEVNCDWPEVDLKLSSAQAQVESTCKQSLVFDAHLLFLVSLNQARRRLTQHDLAGLPAINSVTAAHNTVNKTITDIQFKRTTFEVLSSSYKKAYDMTTNGTWSSNQAKAFL